MDAPKDEGRTTTSAMEDDHHKLLGDGQNAAFEGQVVIVDDDPKSKLAKVKIWDGYGYKIYSADGQKSDEVPICRNSLMCIPIQGSVRQFILRIVEHQWFDSFILLCIVVNSILMVLEQRRAGQDDPMSTEGWKDDNLPNMVIAIIGDWVLTIIFALECVMKIFAWGFVLNKKTYLRDPWNILDFVVVCSSLIELTPLPLGNLSFLRLFRVLRPLRSLNRMPELKVLVNTAISAVPRLGSVAALGLFIFLVFAIIGITLMPGIFYRRCRETEFPSLGLGSNNNTCWHWDFSGASGGRLCGGLYNCMDYVRGQEYRLGYCFGHEAETGDLKPRFPGGVAGPYDGGPYEWCPGSKPSKWSVDVNGEISGWPETDFVHFDHIGGAFLLIFQSMTMEGWTDLMYYAVDGMNVLFAWFYFFMLIVITSHFLLNVALAVVDEAREDFEKEDEEEQAEEEEKSATEDIKADLAVLQDDEEEEEEEPWMDCMPVRAANAVTHNDIFSYFIMFIIAGNVITMMMETFPPQVAVEGPKTFIGRVFLLIFIIEAILEITARGVVGYIKNPTTCFDGVVVIVSIIEEAIALNGGSPGGLKALRTLRLFRVLNKFASRSPPLKILLKAMVATGKALRYWLILFFLVLYICTLMWMHFFANRFQFKENNDPAETFAAVHGYKGDEADPWCPDNRHLGNQYNHLRQGCIPRAHFDNFGWGFVTVFQIMTGENWNTIMYAAMRSGGCSPEGGGGLIECIFYGLMHVGLLLFGQILFLSLFLSMLLSVFDDFKDNMTQEHLEKKNAMLARSKTGSAVFSERFGPKSNDCSKIGSSDSEVSLGRQASPNLRQGNIATDEPEALPGQLIELPQVTDTGSSTAPRKNSHDDHTNESADDCLQDKEIPSAKAWPHGYAWFILSERNPIRRAALWALNKKIRIGSSQYLIFDNFILVCILISTLFMCLNSPLADENAEGWGFIKFVRQADTVFAIIFIVEMVIKLLAFPVMWGENAYLTGPGCAWNWLDAIVVAVSIVTMVFPKGPSFLKTLRILRAFRPLRVINRLETLKMVVETIFKSMMELGMLLVVFLLFLLIFALVALMYLKGTFYACDGENIAYMVDLTDTTYPLMMPLCFDPSFSDTSYTGAMSSNHWDDSTRTMSTTSCAPNQLSWQRMTVDTPICLARCSPYSDKVSALCPRRYETTEELPSVCPEDRFRVWAYNESEAVGEAYVSAMTTSYTVPCAGAPTPTHQSAESVSCRTTFCPDVSDDMREGCKSECEDHPDFCKETCSANANSVECVLCREECQAACECSEFCQPLMKDAALCLEQGGSWGEMLSQNFNNVANSMLTLLEISTTEGWVDVMYAACDIDMGGPYIQPQRDSQTHPVWMIFFSLWIMFSFMFLMNLGVGIIVDKFMEMQDQGKEALLTDGQKKWVKTRMALHARGMIFPLYNLHELPEIRRKVYDFVSNKHFERTIMSCIVINTLLMAVVVFPELEGQAWWDGQNLGLKALLGNIFAFIFTVECVLKLFALRSFYWKDTWNIFDFSCVTATIVGMVLAWANTGINIASLASVIRIFRIARLFRLLRFKPLRPLNKLFMSLAISLVKLANVGVVMMLFLVLFSILGVSLFSTVKAGDTLNEHGNFRHFPNAFVTLFRASTGEAWNNIMHDLAKNEADWFRQGEWCTPAQLFDTSDKFQVLLDKCLIDYPNSCVANMGGWNPFPWVYWISYTLFIGMVIMNVVIAVILQGYDETRTSDEASIIDTCKVVWSENYDPDHKMKLPRTGKGGAIHFVFAAARELYNDGLVDGKVEVPLGGCLTRIPMKYARALDMPADEEEVSFHTAVTQVLRITAVIDAEYKGKPQEFENIVDDLDKTDSAEIMAKSKEVRKIKNLERRNSVSSGGQGGTELSKTIAAKKMQACFKLAQHAKKKRECQSAQVQDLTTGSADLLDANRDDSSEDLRAAAASEAVAEPTGLKPPIAG